jgi:hypothetical protein
MPETTHSKIAVALADALILELFTGPKPQEPNARKSIHRLIATTVDERLEDIRKHYEPEKLARCPRVSHDGESTCVWCVCAAMREFILLPTEL